MSDLGGPQQTSSRIGAMHDLDGLLSACRELIRGEMPRLLGNLFERLDEALKDLTDKAESEAQRSGFLDAMRMFSRERGVIQSRFLSLLASDSPPSAPATTRTQEYEAQGPDSDPILAAEREEALVLKNLVSKAETRYGSELGALRSQLASRLGREALNGDADPLGPKVICEAFHTALESLLGLDRPIKLIVYKIFDKQVMDELGGLYVRCLKCIVRSLAAASAEAEPGLAAERPLERQQRSVARAAVREAVDGPAVLDDGRESTAFENLRNLLARRREKDLAASDAAIEDTSELLAVFEHPAPPDRSAAKGSGRVVEPMHRLDELHERVGGTSGSNLVKVDEDTLDLVFLLFENILRGNGLPDAIKALIARLQIAISKVALAEKSFFDDKHHPARRFLDHLAQSALGWVDDGDRSPDGVYGRIEQAVERVLEDQGRDPLLFSRLDATFSRRLAREQEQARSAEDRARQELEETERKRTDHALVRRVIDERLRAYAQVPEPVRSLVKEGWARVMQSALRDGGVGGAPWRSARATLDQLLWSVQPKSADEERRELLRNIPELLRTLRESLAAVAYDQSLLAAKFRELQALHIAALRRPGAETGTLSVVPKQGGVRPVPALASVPARGVAEVANVKAADAPNFAPADLRVGTWVEVRRGGEVSRVKLAWAGRESGTHLFVDRRGKKALQLHSEELASLFENGSAIVVCDGNCSLVDRAMGDLVYFLKSA